MTAETDQTKEEFVKFASAYGPKMIVSGIVVNVNEDDTVVVQFSEGGEVDDCRLKAVVKEGNKVLLIPAVNSSVLVGRIENSDEFIVLAVDEVSKMELLIGDVRFEIDESGFVVKKGEDTLKDVIRLVIEAVKIVVVMQGRNPDYLKLQQALTKLNNIMQ